jgi:hypothetical protein
MSDEQTQGQERDLGKRIASLIQSIGHGPRKQISGEELEKLKAAVGRLDQMLKDAADADRQALRDAAGRLDRLLGDLRKGKGVTHPLRRRERAR